MSQCDFYFKRLVTDENNLRTEVLSCKEFRESIEKLKKEFRDMNKTEEVIRICGIDRSYERYCKELENIMSECKCLPEKCDKCTEEQHEGHLKMFCRCEGRNIKVAKELRDKGISWSKYV